MLSVNDHLCLYCIYSNVFSPKSNLLLKGVTAQIMVDGEANRGSLECPEGYIIQQFKIVDYATKVDSIEEVKCSRPNTDKIVPTTCEEIYPNQWTNKDVDSDRTTCQDGYFLNGIYSNNNEEWCGTDCWSRWKCCRYDIENVIKPLPDTEQTYWLWDALPSDLTEDFDNGQISELWLKVPNNTYIIGFERGNDPHLNVLGAITRKVEIRLVYIFFNKKLLSLLNVLCILSNNDNKETNASTDTSTNSKTFDMNY